MLSERERNAFFTYFGLLWRPRGTCSLDRHQAMLIRVGEVFMLPSGCVVRVRCAADPWRPWHVVGRGSDARVCRVHSDPVAPGVEFYSEFGSDDAMTFEECDAKVFAAVLNEARGLRLRGDTAAEGAPANCAANRNSLERFLRKENLPSARSSGRHISRSSPSS